MSCPHIRLHENEILDENCGQVVTAGATCRFFCDVGYEGEPVTRTCGKRGTWEGPSLICTGKEMISIKVNKQTVKSK